MIYKPSDLYNKLRDIEFTSVEGRIINGKRNSPVKIIKISGDNGILILSNDQRYNNPFVQRLIPDQYKLRYNYSCRLNSHAFISDKISFEIFDTSFSDNPEYILLDKNTSYLINSLDELDSFLKSKNLDLSKIRVFKIDNEIKPRIEIELE